MWFEVPGIAVSISMNGSLCHALSRLQVAEFLHECQILVKNTIVGGSYRRGGLGGPGVLKVLAGAGLPTV